MSKSSSVDLNDLIYSLNTGEIVYFKKYSKRYCEKESEYIKLFDTIKSEQVQQASNGSLAKVDANKNRHADHKWYLYNLILESLTAYHKNNRLDFQVRDMISKGTLLMNKKLFTQALKIIEKAKELILKNNINYALNEVLALEGTLKMEIFNEPNIIDYFKKLFVAYRHSTTSLNNLSNLLEIRYIAKSLYCKYGILAHIADKKTLAYCTSKLAEIDSTVLSPIEQIIYENNAVNLYPYGKAEAPYHTLFTELKRKCDADQNFIKQHTHNYLYMLSNSITRYIIFNNMVETQNNLQALKNLDKTNELFKERYFKTLTEVNVFYFEQVLLLKNKNVTTAYGNLKIIKTIAVVNIKTLPTRVQLRNYYLFSLICFYNQQYEESLDWLAMIFNEPASRLDLQLLARMYEIACHTELNNIVLVRHKVVALNRFCKKQLESILQIKCFTKLVKLFLDEMNEYKNKKLRNHLEANLIDLCKQESIDKFGFDIVIYCIQKNNGLSFSDAFDYYNCDVNTTTLAVVNS